MLCRCGNHTDKCDFNVSSAFLQNNDETRSSHSSWKQWLLNENQTEITAETSSLIVVRTPEKLSLPLSTYLCVHLSSSVGKLSQRQGRNMEMPAALFLHYSYFSSRWIIRLQLMSRLNYSGGCDWAWGCDRGALRGRRPQTGSLGHKGPLSSSRAHPCSPAFPSSLPPPLFSGSVAGLMTGWQKSGSGSSWQQGGSITCSRRNLLRRRRLE